MSHLVSEYRSSYSLTFVHIGARCSVNGTHNDKMTSSATLMTRSRQLVTVVHVTLAASSAWQYPIEKISGCCKRTRLYIGPVNAIWSGAKLEMIEVETILKRVHADFTKLSAKNRCHRKTWTDCTIAITAYWRVPIHTWVEWECRVNPGELIRAHPLPSHHCPHVRSPDS